MFIADGLVYLELQKTGGSHIRRLLSEYTDGHCDGKHNLLRPEYLGNFVFGSIRNPWDWYVSLWASGVGGRGGLRSRCVTGVDFSYYHRLLPKDLGKNWLTPGELIRSCYHDAVKPLNRWQKVYKNANDPALFRAWLKLLLARERRFDIGEGFGFSPLSMHAGFLTYRYFRLFAGTMFNTRIFSDRRLASLDGIAEYDHEFNFARGMVRTETLEEDFIRVLREAGISLSDEQITSIRNKEGGKTNVSKRRPVGYYYDEETVALVEKRDRYLIEKYGYKAPIL